MTRRCRICKAKFEPVRQIQPTCGLFSCAVAYAEQAAAKSKAKREKAEREQIRTRKAALLPMQHFLKKTERAVHAYIRARDASQPCISCGTWDTSAWTAGHFISVGAKASTRYDYANIHRQCEQCNLHKAGNATQYEIRLIARIGITEVERLKCAPIDHKWTRDELLAIKARAKADLRALPETP